MNGAAIVAWDFGSGIFRKHLSGRAGARRPGNVAIVVIPRALSARAGGAERLEVAAPDVRRLLAELDRRFPGLGEALARDAAIAIDGEILPDAMLEPLDPESEVHFLPRVAGGR